MQLALLLSGLCAAGLAGAEAQTAQIYVQPIIDASSSSSSFTSPPPSPLAEVTYDMAALSQATVTSFEGPESPDAARLVRVGLYDAAAQRWTAGTTVAAADNFRKGYSPHIALAVDARGRVLAASCKGVAIDAGHTRDFGPKVVVLPDAAGKQPVLNKPVVLSPEGKKVEPPPEKTFLQKYWWMIAIAVFVALSGGGGGEK